MCHFKHLTVLILLENINVVTASPQLALCSTFQVEPINDICIYPFSFVHLNIAFQYLPIFKNNIKTSDRYNQNNL